MKKKFLLMLLVVCVTVSCVVTGASAAEEEHEHEYTYLQCGTARCWCGDWQYGWNHGWSWEIVDSAQHCKKCIYCGIRGSFENHGWYTSGGRTYCGSCGYPKP